MKALKWSIAFTILLLLVQAQDNLDNSTEDEDEDKVMEELKDNFVLPANQILRHSERQGRADGLLDQLLHFIKGGQRDKGPDKTGEDSSVAEKGQSPDRPIPIFVQKQAEHKPEIAAKDTVSTCDVTSKVDVVVEVIVDANANAKSPVAPPHGQPNVVVVTKTEVGAVGVSNVAPDGAIPGATGQPAGGGTGVQAGAIGRQTGSVGGSNTIAGGSLQGSSNQQVGGITESQTGISGGSGIGTNTGTDGTFRGTRTGGITSTSAPDEDDEGGAGGEGDTTTVDLIDATNSTITVNGFTAPSSSPTPVPEATNFVLDEVTYQFLEIVANATNYVMGGLLPITRGREPWLAGVQYVEAFKCQLNILNSNSRILPVSLMTYLIQNTDILVSEAMKQAFLLQQKNVFMTVGPTTDDQVPPIAYLNAPERLAFVSFQASSITLANSTIYPSFFRTIPSDAFQARAMAETMRLFGWNFVAALFTTDSYGTSGRSALLSQTGRQRIKVTCSNSIMPGSISGLSSFADCVATSDASVVVLWMDELNAANALSFLYRNATNSRLTFIASNRWARIEDPLAFNTSVVQRTGSGFPLSFIEGTLGFIPQIGQLGQYQACASVVNPENTHYPEFLQVWEDEFRCQYNATDTIPPCPEEIEERTFECRCTGNENFASLPINPLVNYVQDSVNIMYNALDSLFNPSRCLKLRRPRICNLKQFTPQDYVTSLSLVSLNGLTGPIQFNQTQPDRRRSNFDIYQYREDGFPEQVGIWNITGPFLGQNLLEFKTSPAYPTSILVPDNTEFGNGFWPKLVAILSGLGLFLVLCLIVYAIVMRGTRVIRRTNLLWLLIFLTAIGLVFLSSLIWTFRQTTTICTIKSLLAFFGFALIVACIVVKVQRIFRVMINAGQVSMTLGTAELFIVLGLVMLLPIALMIFYIFSGGEPPQATVTQSTVDNTYVFIACAPRTQSSKQLLRDIYIGYMLLLGLIAAIFLLLSRSLTTAYSEAEFLFLILIDFLLVAIIMIPLYFTVGDRRGSVLQTFLLRSLAVLFAMYLTLALLAIPKIIAINKHRSAKKKRKDESQSLMASSGAARYAEVPTTDESGSESDMTSAAGSASNKPKFISQTNTRASSGTGTGTTTGTGTGTTSGSVMRRQNSGSKT